MAYSVVDLLNKFINIEQNGYEMFLRISSVEDAPTKVKTIAKVFAKEELRHIELYKSLRGEIDESSGVELDFDIYDKASKLISEFSNIFHQPRTEDVRKMLEFCLDFEKENLALLLSIQGLLVKMNADTQSKVYKILTEVINEELKHVENVNYFIK